MKIKLLFLIALTVLFVAPAKAQQVVVDGSIINFDHYGDGMLCRVPVTYVAQLHTAQQKSAQAIVDFVSATNALSCWNLDDKTQLPSYYMFRLDLRPDTGALVFLLWGNGQAWVDVVGVEVSGKTVTPASIDIVA